MSATETRTPTWRGGDPACVHDATVVSIPGGCEATCRLCGATKTFPPYADIDKRDWAVTPARVTAAELGLSRDQYGAALASSIAGMQMYHAVLAVQDQRRR